MKQLGLLCVLLAVVTQAHAVEEFSGEELSPREKEMAAQCVKRLRYEWPSNEKIVHVISRRYPDNNRIFIDVNLSRDAENVFQMARMNVSNKGSCRFDGGELHSIRWFVDTGTDVVTRQADAPDFEWKVSK